MFTIILFNIFSLPSVSLSFTIEYNSLCMSFLFSGSHVLCTSMCQFYLQDTKSSNGTFINSQRLSRGSEESPPCEVLSGDIIQFGVDVTENTRKGTCIYIIYLHKASRSTSLVI